MKLGDYTLTKCEHGYTAAKGDSEGYGVDIANAVGDLEDVLDIPLEDRMDTSWVLLTDYTELKNAKEKELEELRLLEQVVATKQRKVLAIQHKQNIAAAKQFHNLELGAKVTLDDGCMAEVIKIESNI